MRIVILTRGSRGEVQSLVPLKQAEAGVGRAVAGITALADGGRG